MTAEAAEVTVVRETDVAIADDCELIVLPTLE